MQQSTTWILVRLALVATMILLLLHSIDRFIHYKALIPQATDPTDGIGYRMIVSAGLAVISAGSILGILSTFLGRSRRATGSDPSAF